MTFNEQKRIFNEIDEIDHLTLRRRLGKDMDPRAAARLIRRYRALDADVARALDLSDADAAFERLSAADQETLFRLLVRVRTALLAKTGL